ncbi:hypothetical protein BAE44_0000930 [Dichanthelium oligosanthes]|uniref:FAR1 domain-containing protein n=1 Tax=Dichanthelium oligosanthes TaxID=888268 RepID=A0A1E5WKW7_9POAL|nr:hypothetical protein BAE44_0000930 [Dichanthelium oligosanthes]
MSSSDDPYVGKMFDTVQEARVFYNAYAKRKGFSIRNGTSRRSAITDELDKVKFVCNKEGKGEKSKDHSNEAVELSGCENGDTTGSESDVQVAAVAKKKCTWVKGKRSRENEVYELQSKNTYQV